MYIQRRPGNECYTGVALPPLYERALNENLNRCKQKYATLAQEPMLTAFQA
jgi:hypothetical protein